QRHVPVCQASGAERLEAGVPRRRFAVPGFERDRGERGLPGGRRVVRAVARGREAARMTHLLPALMLLLQTQATNAELGYRFALPNGFTAFPEGRGLMDRVDSLIDASSV